MLLVVLVVKQFLEMRHVAIESWTFTNARQLVAACLCFNVVQHEKQPASSAANVVRLQRLYMQGQVGGIYLQACADSKA